jgi:hypothetical protein
MDRESFRQERRALCGQIELSRREAAEWIDQKVSPSIVKMGLKLFVRYGLTSLVAQSPFSLARFLFK